MGSTGREGLAHRRHPPGSASSPGPAGRAVVACYGAFRRTDGRGRRPGVSFPGGAALPFIAGRFLMIPRSRDRGPIPFPSLSGLIMLAAGLPRAAAAQVSTATVPAGFVDDRVVGGLALPVGMTFLPDGRLLVVEQQTA